MTRYLTEDHLGTPRVITDSEGNVISRRDFLPFGEEFTDNTGERTPPNTALPKRRLPAMSIDGSILKISDEFSDPFERCFDLLV